ncbi:MAG: protein kinase [Myxococcota bacterium]
MAGGDSMPAKAELLAPGARVGRYHLLRRLAIGGMAELQLACAEGLAGFQKVVVLKHVLPHLAADPDFVELFLNEARLAATLTHPNIVQVSDIGEADGDYFYVMEYVHGRNARELLREAGRRGSMPLDVALTIGIGAAAALSHAHEARDLAGEPLGLVHRDLSPANLLVSYDGAVKLTDFGIAKAAARSTETIGGAVKGKIGYMSPEQCRGETVDQRSDIFALGVVLCELTTCERLFFADNDFAILNKVISGSFERPSERVAGYPPELERIVLKALAGDRDERYATADALRQDLETFAHERRLRTSAATIADWMRETFGRPPFPRVEVVPAPTPGAPVVPTLVADPAGEERTTTIRTPSPATEVVIQPEGLMPMAPPRRRGWVFGVLAAGGIAAAGVAWAAGGSASETSAAAPAVPAQSNRVSPVSEEVAGAVEVTPPASEEPAVPEAGSSGGPERVEPPETPPRSRPRHRAKKPRKKSSADAHDLGALYPVKR